VSLIQYTASTGPPPPVPLLLCSRSPLPFPVANTSYTLCMRASVVKAGQSLSYMAGFFFSLLWEFSGIVAQKDRCIHVRARGRPSGVTVASVNSTEEPPRWEANRGFHGAVSMGVWDLVVVVDMVRARCARRGRAREASVEDDEGAILQIGNVMSGRHADGKKPRTI
jgi:hypothetical protein